MGIGYFPSWLFDDELASGQVQQILPDWETIPIPIHVVSPLERPHSATVKAFAEHIGKAMAR
ncbi:MULTISPECIES: LysR substrate-binding domain-containing protein [Paraburkholderia]|jgi:DNA-binding transcriptional LysR family regulator|uniref:LysR substrate-binding domain-containing protein n=1 Tax=Paraburkholderia dipogonis TaxID=1211383 RepID=A0ABW9B2Y7_9BURK